MVSARGQTRRKTAGETDVGDRVAKGMTIEEFLTWQADQEQRFEFVDGQPVAMAGAKLRHDRQRLF